MFNCFSEVHIIICGKKETFHVPHFLFRIVVISQLDGIYNHCTLYRYIWATHWSTVHVCTWVYSTYLCKCKGLVIW